MATVNKALGSGGALPANLRAVEVMARNFDFSTAFHDGFVLYIPIEIIKAAIGALLLPAAWKLAEKTR